jgi:hypothetical protein
LHESEVIPASIDKVGCTPKSRPLKVRQTDSPVALTRRAQVRILVEIFIDWPSEPTFACTSRKPDPSSNMMAVAPSSNLFQIFMSSSSMYLLFLCINHLRKNSSVRVKIDAGLHADNMESIF